MILVLYSKQPKSAQDMVAWNVTKKQLDTDAKALQAKLQGKGRGVKIAAGKYDEKICYEHDYKAYLSGKESAHETKIHVVGHGNQQVLEPFKSGEELADFLFAGGKLKTKPKIQSVTLHACYSFALHPGSTNVNQVFAFRLLQRLVQLHGGHDAKQPQYFYFKVRGVNGKEHTLPDGRSWVLKDGKDNVLPKMLPPAGPKYDAMLSKLMVARPAARPIITYQNGTYVITTNGHDDDYMTDGAAHLQNQLGWRAAAAGAPAAGAAAAAGAGGGAAPPMQAAGAGGGVAPAVPVAPAAPAAQPIAAAAPAGAAAAGAAPAAVGAGLGRRR
ncbi:hypothetical protein A7982_13025 [Minicystis rosea]|nr:hypothetical protein A7982_13025 [Minicystis rosea]